LQKILIVNNGYLQMGLSGGDAHLLGVGEEWSKINDVTFLIPAFACDFVKGGRCCSYWSWIPRSVAGIVLVYMQRIIRSYAALWRFSADVTVAGGILVDVFPAWLHAVRFKSTLVLYVFHLIPRRKGDNLSRSVQYFISWVAQRVALLFYRRADVVFTDNSLVKQELVSLGMDAQKIHVQYPVVEVEAARDAVPLRRFNILFIGRLVRQKGVYDLLEAVLPLSVSVGLIGKGEEYDGLLEFIRLHGLEDRVKLLGFISSEEKYGLLKGCDLFVLPSYEEGYGIVIGEAIAAGRPVIAYYLPHYQETFADSLLLVPPGDMEALREQILAALCNDGLVARVCERYKNVVLRSAQSAAAEEWRVIQRVISC